MMETNTEQTTPPVGEPTPLVRPVTGRVVAGVAAGLATRLDVPAWVIRLIFVVLAFAGGTGFALYLIGWLFIPKEGESESLAVRTFSRADGTTSWIGIGLIALAILIAVQSIGFIRGDFAFAAVLLVVGVLLYRGDLRGGFRTHRTDETAPEGADGDTLGSPASADTARVVGEPDIEAGTEIAPPVASVPSSAPAQPRPPRRPKHPPSYLGRLTIGLGLVTLGVMAFADYAMTTFDPSTRHYVGVGLAFVAAGLLVGGWFGRARGLIVVGFILIPVLLISPFAEFGFDGPIGERRVSPASVAEIESDYQMAIGQLVIDLRDVDFGSGTVTLDARVGIGSLQIIVPDGVAIEGEARVGIGEVRTPSATRSGFARVVDLDTVGTGTLLLDARTNLGEVSVRSAVGSAATGVGTSNLGVGDRDLTITDVSQLQDVYDYNAGNLVLDLSAVDLTGVELPRDVSIDMGTGDVTVIVGNADLVDVNAEVGVGRIELFGRSANGLGLDRVFDGDADAAVILDIHVGAGSLTVEEN